MEINDKDWCPKCKVMTEMSRGLDNTLRCVCGYIIVQLWRQNV